MLHILPARLPYVHDLEPPLRPITLHPRDHPAHGPLWSFKQKRRAVELPQPALVPELESAIEMGRVVVVEVFDDKVLFATWLWLAPGGSDASIELQHDVLVQADRLATHVQSFTNAEADAESGVIARAEHR